MREGNQRAHMMDELDTAGDFIRYVASDAHRDELSTIFKARAEELDKPASIKHANIVETIDGK
ncbi:hypothetical protein BSU04_21330 [Caballeronia sordidicola]|uniref:Uncharacterized protein n=2 Tax=Caballeronia sordidicola TaxID=196367 RepID=A0A226WZD6_CABSO|nr:hypothetical protein BSU04_21330 [Caballeronia sordidicola]